MKPIVVKIRPLPKGPLKTVVVLSGHVIRYENKFFQFADRSLGFKFRKLKDAIAWVNLLSKEYRL